MFRTQIWHNLTVFGVVMEQHGVETLVFRLLKVLVWVSVSVLVRQTILVLVLVLVF